jgi:hypothetical protein
MLTGNVTLFSCNLRSVNEVAGEQGYVSSHIQVTVHTRLMMAIASSDRNRGYRTSSFTIESKTSSSSSPGKGD